VRTSYLFWGLLLVGTLVVFFQALNDLTIFIRGRIDEDTNPGDFSPNELRERPPKPSSLRLVAGLRLLGALTWLILVVCILVVRLRG
jgi:hypothetical protein